jgi:hypothetical protein
MPQETGEIVDPKRRTVLKALGMGAAGTALLPSSATAQSSSVGDVVFEDDFEDGQLDWTDADHPEFWTEESGQVHYNPSTSAGDTGDNFLYADETFDDDQGLLEWPVAIEFKGYASDTSAGLGALATTGGPTASGAERGTPRLAITDSTYEDQFHVWNSEGEQFTLPGARDNNTWYTYRLVPDLENNEIQISINDESWTIDEPNDDPIGNTSIALSGGTCWGCGGNGDRRYEYITVWEVPRRGQGASDLPIPMDALSSMEKTVSALRDPWTTTAWQAARRMSRQLMNHFQNMLTPDVEDALPDPLDEVVQIFESTAKAFEILAEQRVNLSRVLVRNRWNTVSSASSEMFEENYSRLGYNVNSREVLNKPYLPLYTAIRDDLVHARRTQSDEAFSTLHMHAASVDSILGSIKPKTISTPNESTEALVYNLRSFHIVTKTIKDMTEE